MSCIYLISDTHFANRSAFAKESTKYEYLGCNSRFHAIVDSFNLCVKDAVNSEAEALVICGDVFHNRNTVPISVMNAVGKVLEAAAKKIRIIAFPGNHDYVSISGDIRNQSLHSLYLYKDIIDVVSKPEIKVTDSFALSFVPFTPDKDLTIQASQDLFATVTKHEKKRTSIIFFHHSFNGAVTGPTNWMMPYPLEVSDIPNFDFCFSGHLHLHQNIGRLVYVGAPLHHDLGERDYAPGWIKVKNDSWEHIENIVSPRFNLIETSNGKDVLNSKIRESDYLVVRWSGSPTEAYRLRGEQSNILIESQSNTNLNTLRSTIKRDDPITTMISKYVDHKITDPSLRNPYVDFGLNYLK